MSIYASILNILKYAGLILATISSIWTATNVVSKEVGGKKMLTSAGRLAIVLTITGLVVSITSNVLEDRLKSQKASEASIQEFKRTNKIILAGQPLLSLDFRLNCEEVNSNFIKSMELADNNWQHEHQDQQGEVSSSKGDAIQRAYGRLPLFMSSLNGNIENEEQHFLLLISLGEGDAVLSYGYLSDSFKLDKLSKGILFDDDVWRGVEYGSDIKIWEPYFSGIGSSVQLRWNLNPFTLYSCLHKINPNITITANMPSTIKVAILYDFKSLPFLTEDLTSYNRFIWTEDNTLSHTEENPQPLNHIYSNSSLALIPNQLLEQASRYNISGVYQKSIIDEEWEETENCKALLLVFEKVDEK